MGTREQGQRASGNGQQLWAGHSAVFLPRPVAVPLFTGLQRFIWDAGRLSTGHLSRNTASYLPRHSGRRWGREDSWLKILPKLKEKSTLSEKVRGGEREKVFLFYFINILLEQWSTIRTLRASKSRWMTCRPLFPSALYKIEFFKHKLHVMTTL